MVLILPKMFEFAAPPRTGVHWFVEACTKAGLETLFSNPGTNNIHLVTTSFTSWYGQRQVEKNTLRISLVRHPCDWLRSMFDAWQNKQDTLIREYMGYCCFHYRGFVKPPDSDFNKFVTRHLERRSGEIGRIFDSYRADIRLRLEDMPWALIELLESLGIEQNKLNQIVDLPPQSKTASRSTWQSNLRQQVLESEASFCRDLDYY